MSISDLILQAKTKKAQSVLFVVGSAPQVQVLDEWTQLRESPLLMSEWNILQQSLLSPQQKTLLENQGHLLSEGLFGGTRVGFSFYQKEEAMKVWLNLELASKESLEHPLPPILSEKALAQKGLILISGANENSLCASVYSVLAKMNAEKVFSAAIFSSGLFPRLREEKGLFLYHQDFELVPSALDPLIAGVDVVIFHGYSDAPSFLMALKLAEKGKFVLYDMVAPSLFNAFRRIYSFIEPHLGRHGTGRLAEVLELALGQIAMRGLAQETIYAYEILMMKPQVRQLIEDEKLNELEELLKTASENSGMINSNQALLQHLVRRRIDIKTAFERSRDPDALDQLLKKVGI